MGNAKYTLMWDQLMGVYPKSAMMREKENLRGIMWKNGERRRAKSRPSLQMSTCATILMAVEPQQLCRQSLFDQTSWQLMAKHA